MGGGTVIVGGGAAGLAAAGVAPRPVHVVEALGAVGGKILRSGGGRCNITRREGMEGLLAAYGAGRRFVGPAIRAFPPEAICGLLAAGGVATREEGGGCIFPASGEARDVLKVLVGAAEGNGATFWLGAEAGRILVEGGRACGVELVDGRQILAERVVVACGGLGGGGRGHTMVRGAGVAVTRLVPALVGLVTEEGWPRRHAGVSLGEAVLRVEGAGGGVVAGRGAPLLFTHEGLGGPAAMNASGGIAERLAGGAGGVKIWLSFCGGLGEGDWRARLRRGRVGAGGCGVAGWLVGEGIPRAVGRTVCGLARLGEGAVLARLTRGEERRLISVLLGAPLRVCGTGGFRRAMVTRGGVERGEVRGKTLEARRVGGLRFAGEVLDVDGPCGGYNLTWAVASGRLAGSAGGG